MDLKKIIMYTFLTGLAQVVNKRSKTPLLVNNSWNKVVKKVELVNIGSNFSRIASGTIATPTTDYIATSILHHIFIIILALY